jgi:ribA/ribD-fused uncharacterized protein
MEFRGEYAFLSNFYPAPVKVDDWIFPSAEHAYQAAKSPFQRDWIAIQQMTAGQAKKYGRKIKIRLDWKEKKLEIMMGIVALKFIQHPELMAKLMATGDIQIIEENTWGDRFWGVCQGKGHNYLGIILMSIRALNQEEKLEIS